MKQYFIDVNTIILEASNAEEAEKLYQKKVEDPDFCIEKLQDYEITEDVPKCETCDEYLEDRMHDIDGTNLVEKLTCPKCGHVEE